jgi:ferredoxin
MAFLDDLRRYGDRVQVFPSRVSGRMDLDALLPSEAGDRVAVFCCGPAGLIDAVGDRCSAVPSRRLRVERFQPVIDPALAARGAAFTVELARSRRTLAVADGQTILEAMEVDGLVPACSCREGVCGTCETRVLAGTPDHRDSVLDTSEHEDGATMMICVSRSRTPRLVLDA